MHYNRMNVYRDCHYIHTLKVNLSRGVGTNQIYIHIKDYGFRGSYTKNTQDNNKKKLMFYRPRRNVRWKRQCKEFNFKIPVRLLVYNDFTAIFHFAIRYEKMVLYQNLCLIKIFMDSSWWWFRILLNVGCKLKTTLRGCDASSIRIYDRRNS